MKDSLVKDSFVKIVSPNGDYRYGYITEVLEKGYLIGISLYDEGESKIEFDAEEIEKNPSFAGYIADDYTSELTDIEKRVVTLLAAGLSTKLIADKMFISPVTVRGHLRTLRIKLHLDDRNQLVAFSEGLNKKLQEKDNA